MNARQNGKDGHRNYEIALVPGDGIGPDVIAAGRQVLETVADQIDGLSLSFQSFDWGSERYLETGAMMPADGLDILKQFDAIYFGSAGDPRVPDHISLWQLRLAICQGLDQYANIRHARLLPGLNSPLREAGMKDIDWLIIRENSEGEYSGAGGRVHQSLPLEVGLDVTVITRAGAERLLRYAFAMARERPRKHLTFVTKSNAQRHSMVLWDEVFEELKLQFPDIHTNRMLVDAMAAYFVTNPADIDTVVASNLHADILSDLAAALSGSLGLAPTANINPDNTTPSMFEPIHGSAFDIIGRGIANPIGAIWSAKLMLDHLGEGEAGVRVMKAIERVTEQGAVLPRDLGGQSNTAQVTEAVCSEL